MARSARLLAVLKQQLKARGITYRALATELALSESSIKQMFAGGNMTLSRLDAICEVLDLDISDLVLIGERDTRRTEVLTLEQEQELVSDPRLLVVAYCIVNHWTLEEILERYTVSDTEAVRYLARLDRMRLIELQPGNRVKLLIAPNFAWQKNGPIDRFFRAEVQGQFFGSDFDDTGCLRLIKNGDISVMAREQLIERLQSAGLLFDDLSRQERRLPSARRQGTTMVLAIRHWEFSAFAELERR